MRKITRAYITISAVVLGVVCGGFAQQNVIESIVPPSVIFEALALNKDLGNQEEAQIPFGDGVGCLA